MNIFVKTGKIYKKEEKNKLKRIDEFFLLKNDVYCG